MLKSPAMRALLALVVPAACLGLSFSVRADDASVLPAEDAIPDLTQTDEKGNFAGGGRSFCGPVAVSNSFMAMFGEDLKWEGVSHYDLANKLASHMFMNTHVTKGTSVEQLLRGVDLYLDERGVKEYSLKFQGWRRCDARHRTRAVAPRLAWIKDILAQGGAVWLNVGWYTNSSKEGEYRRSGGHWVTAVGFGQDASGDRRPDYLVIHDPAPRAGLRPSREFVKMTRLESGRINGPMQGLPRPAHAFYRMEGGMHIKKGADLAILDGAVGLLLAERNDGNDDR